MKIAVLSPIYATSTGNDAATPVVHYFAREWVKMGHEVRVYHLVARYPLVFYLFGKLFFHRLTSKLGFPVPTKRPTEETFTCDGVRISRITMFKSRPHGKFSRRRTDKVVARLCGEFTEDWMPDVITGHWIIPQLDIIPALKKQLGIPSCIVLHNNLFNWDKFYGKGALDLISTFDLIGFRSFVARSNYEAQYGTVPNSFIASSGVSSAFLEEGRMVEKTFDSPVKSFLFVGSLIERKFPGSIVEALDKAFPEGGYKMTFIGDGEEKDRIVNELLPSCKGEVVFTGRLTREEVMPYLKEADCFVMISRKEIFGLVYLEAMSFGVIPIGSRRQGIDGIIVNGDNGFLCQFGDSDELAEIIRHIRTMPREDLLRMSARAKQTAMEYSDSGVAKKYLDALSEIAQRNS